MTTIAKVTKSALDSYYRMLKILLTLLMLLMIVPVLLQILSRYSGIFPRYIWTEEVARFCFVWIVMIGSMIAVRDETHFKVDLLPQPDTDREKGVANLSRLRTATSSACSSTPTPTSSSRWQVRYFRTFLPSRRRTRRRSN